MRILPAVIEVMEMLVKLFDISAQQFRSTPLTFVENPAKSEGVQGNISSILPLQDTIIKGFTSLK